MLIRTRLHLAQIGAVLLLFIPFSSSAQLIQLSAGTSFSSLREVVVSPDGRWVAYVQDNLVDGEDTLWIASSRGGEPRRLSPVGITAVDNVRFGQDSTRLVFLGRATGDNQLYGNSVNGSALTAVALSAGDEVGDYFGPNGVNDRLIYIERVGGTYRRYTVPLTGPAGARIELPITADSDDGQTALSPDGNWILFKRSSGPLSSLNLADLGAPAVGLEPPTGYDRFQFFPDSSRILLKDTSEDLFSVPIGGPSTSAVNLTDGLAAANERMSPDGQWVVFASFPNLYSVPSSGPSAAIELIDATLGAQSGTPSPDSDSVFLVSSSVGGQAAGLYAGPIDGSLSPTKLSGSVTGTGTGLIAWEVSEQANSVVMQESRLGEGISAGYRRPLDNLQGGSELVWTLLITADDWEVHPQGKSILLQGRLTNSQDTAQRLWTARLAPTLQTEEEILNEEDLPHGLDLDEAFFGPTGDIFIEARLSGRGELFVIPGPIFEDGFEDGNTASWTAQ